LPDSQAVFETEKGSGEMNEIEKASEVLTSEEKTIEFLEYLVRVTGFIEKDGPFRFFTKNFIAKRTGETLRATYNCAEKAFMIALKALYREQERDTEAKRRRAEENPKPLTLDELIRMDGEPVWIEDKQDGGQWGLVDLNHKTLVWYEPPVQAMVLKDGNFYILREYEAYGENLQAYRTKPEGSGE
jgi:hypothetical protein